MNPLIVKEKCCGNCARFEEAIPKRNDPSEGECKDRATVYLTSPHCETYEKASWDLIRGRVHQIIAPWQQDDFMLSKKERELTDGQYILNIERLDMPDGIFEKWWYKLTHPTETFYYHLVVPEFKGEIGEIREFRVVPIMVKSEWHTTMRD